MEITQKRYDLMAKYAKKIAYKHPQLVEDLIQDACIKLINNTNKVEYEVSYLYTTVLHTYLNTIKSYNIRVREEQKYYKETASHHPPVDNIGVKELLTTIERTLGKKQLSVVQSLIDNPDVSYKHIAKEQNVPENTFKANIRHLRFKLLSSEYILDSVNKFSIGHKCIKQLKILNILQK